MKNLLLIILFVLSGSQLCFAQDLSKVTKEDVLATVQHIQKLATEQKVELVKAQADYLKQGDELAKAQAIAIQKAKEAHDNAKQRDVLLYAFGIMAGFWIGSLFGGEVLRQFPFPYGLIACVSIYVISAIGAYALGRLLLASLARFIP